MRHSRVLARHMHYLRSNLAMGVGNVNDIVATERFAISPGRDRTEMIENLFVGVSIHVFAES